MAKKSKAPLPPFEAVSLKAEKECDTVAQQLRERMNDALQGAFDEFCDTVANAMSDFICDARREAEEAQKTPASETNHKITLEGGVVFPTMTKKAPKCTRKLEEGKLGEPHLVMCYNCGDATAFSLAVPYRHEKTTQWYNERWDLFDFVQKWVPLSEVNPEVLHYLGLDSDIDWDSMLDVL